VHRIAPSHQFICQSRRCRGTFSVILCAVDGTVATNEGIPTMGPCDAWRAMVDCMVTDAKVSSEWWLMSTFKDNCRIARYVCTNVAVQRWDLGSMRSQRPSKDPRPVHATDNHASNLTSPVRFTAPPICAYIRH
jgi:hypothetical protein